MEHKDLIEECDRTMRRLRAQIFGLEDELAASKILATFTQLILPIALSWSLWSALGWYTGWAMGIAYDKLRK